MRLWSIFAALRATAVGPQVSWLQQAVCTGPMQSETGSKALRPSGVAPR